MISVAVNKNTIPVIEGDQKDFTLNFGSVNSGDGWSVYRLTLNAETAASPQPVTIRWQLPAINVKGVWTSGSLYEKRLKADWESVDMESRISVNAPVVCVFGHEDENRMTFAVSDATYTAKLSAPVREEDNLIYCSVELFTEPLEPITEYEVDLLIDGRNILFSDCLQGVGDWWENALGNGHAPVADACSDPVYSTWYSYHQEISPGELLEECRLAAEMGYGTIIVDDGWQTFDNKRGYDYTGDWEAERFTEMAQFVADVKELGMKTMLWYSVPFCGVKSEAYQIFKGKFLTENHRWAPVFDPRYPEVRAHLVSKYKNALIDWKLDGFKLDFIDDFTVYSETPEGKADGRDFANVNRAVEQLVDEIVDALRSIKPDVLIEFRQKYIGPQLRKLGNMLRAFDCPNDSVTNRLRTTDVRLLAGSSRVHADMLTWHPGESAELAALQFNNILFSVPQVSVRLADQKQEHLDMIRFLTRYYNENRGVLMSGEFRAYGPLENYPLLSASTEDKTIYGLYGNAIVKVAANTSTFDIINGRLESRVIVDCAVDMGMRSLRIYDARGREKHQSHYFTQGINILTVPASGIVCIA